MSANPDPQRWTREELDDARLLAIGDFIAGRNEEGGESYAAMLSEAIGEVERLLTVTGDLTAIGEGAFLVEDPTLAGPYRHTAGPPISEADLATMAGVRVNPRRYTTDEAQNITVLVSAARDRARIPWLDAGPPRMADTAERRAAILSTASLWATQRMATKRRNESADRQEEAVMALVRGADGFTEVPPRRDISAIDDLARGEVCAESTVAGVKADIVVRLLNGKLLLIECKVSGSALNSIKRLIHDVGDKAAVWQREFGSQQVPMAVIAGVFKLKHLEDAQNKGIAIVWERELVPLADFIAAAV